MLVFARKKTNVPIIDKIKITRATSLRSLSLIYFLRRNERGHERIRPTIKADNRSHKFIDPSDFNGS